MAITCALFSVLAAFGIIHHQCEALGRFELTLTMVVFAFASVHYAKFFYKEYKSPIPY